MANQRGMAFQLAGSKRSGGETAGSKKPISVKDLFSGDSDDEHEEAAPGPKKSRISGFGHQPSPTSLIPAPPADPEVRKVADKLAEFVAKNGDSFEDVTRQRNPGDTPFKFLFDKDCADYKYYQYTMKETRSKLNISTSNSTGGSSRAGFAAWDYHPSSTHARPLAQQSDKPAALHKGLPSGDSVAAMNAYMQMAARKEKSKRGIADEDDEPPSRTAPALNETSFDRRKVVAVIKPDGGRGHHMQDFIPPEEMAKFLAKCGDREAAEAAAALENKNAIGADNIGHKLLQKMGWKDGQGIGASGTGMTVPVQATGVKQDNLGIGAAAVGEVKEDDDIYEQYRKRMMLGYKFRPNPLGNPRKSYY